MSEEPNDEKWWWTKDELDALIDDTFGNAPSHRTGKRKVRDAILERQQKQFAPAVSPVPPTAEPTELYEILERFAEKLDGDDLSDLSRMCREYALNVHESRLAPALAEQRMATDSWHKKFNDLNEESLRLFREVERLSAPPVAPTPDLEDLLARVKAFVTNVKNGEPRFNADFVTDGILAIIDEDLHLELLYFGPLTEADIARGQELAAQHGLSSPAPSVVELEPMMILRGELCSLAAVARVAGLMDAYYAHNTAINAIDRILSGAAEEGNK